MLNSRYVLLALFLSLALGFASSTYSECPPCFNDQVPMAGHGPTPDGTGRRVINVAIDNSWDVTPGHTDPAIWLVWKIRISFLVLGQGSYPPSMTHETH